MRWMLLLGLLCLSAGAERSLPRRIFEGVLVPLAELRSSVLVETPHVGWVRLERAGLPDVEGALAGLGRGQFRIRTAEGLILVAAAEVSSLTQLPAPLAGPQLEVRTAVYAPCGIFEGQPIESSFSSTRLLLPGGSCVELPGWQEDT